MFKVKFEKSELPKNELSYENLKVVSKTHDLMIIMNAISGWFKSNPDCKTTDLEKKLREDNLDIHLISVEPDLDKNKFKPIVICRKEGPIIKKYKFKNIKVYKNPYLYSFSPKPLISNFKLFLTTIPQFLFFFRGIYELVNVIKKNQIQIIYLNL